MFTNKTKFKQPIFVAFLENLNFNLHTATVNLCFVFIIILATFEMTTIYVTN